jgi:diaminopimelate epimerase
VRGTIVYKMTGSGNDFVLLDGRATTPAEWPATRVVQLCDRRTGIGADGLVILTPDQPGAVRMVYWNSDGSRADMCGNAALCSTRLSVYLELAAPGDLRLLTDAGLVQARCPDTGDQAEIRLPDFDLAQSNGTAVSGLEPGPGERWMAFATVGVPHLVIRVDDIEAVDVLGRGRSLRFDPRVGAAGANVNFVGASAAPGGPWLIRTYERGVEGETLACGTGAVASAVLLTEAGETSGGAALATRSNRILRVRLERTLTGWHPSLAGEARLVFQGVFGEL